MPACATGYSDAVNTCLSDSTNGKDRKALARWIFLGLASHPEIHNFSNATDATLDQANQEVGNLFTRLVTMDCAKEYKALAMHEETQSVIKSFEFLGRLAMQEIMSNPAVTSSIGGFEKYVDKAKISAVLGQ